MCYWENISPTLTTRAIILTLIGTVLTVLIVLIVPRVCGGQHPFFIWWVQCLIRANIGRGWGRGEWRGGWGYHICFCFRIIHAASFEYKIWANIYQLHCRSLMSGFVTSLCWTVTRLNRAGGGHFDTKGTQPPPPEYTVQSSGQFPNLVFPKTACIGNLVYKSEYFDLL